MENKNSHKAIFILDNIAQKLYNIIVKQTNALQSTRKTLINIFWVDGGTSAVLRMGNGQQDFAEVYNVPMLRCKSQRKKTEHRLLGGFYLKVGEIRYNSFGTPMKIVDYKSSDNITVEFLDLHKFQKTTTYSNFIRGQVKNPYDRTIRGVGYLGDGKYMTNQSLHERRAFGIWCNMIDRCYNEDVRSKYAAYSDCIICDSWQCYQTFRKWYDDNFYNVGTERMHIDKDILYKNNRVYSPETCILVPQRINMLFMHKPNKYNLPNGVKPSTNGKYEAKYNGKYLGIFESIEEAAIAHNKEKKKVIIQIADEYREQIPSKVYNALIDWIPDYIDYNE